MKTPDMTITGSKELRSYKIEHLPEFDVILNLDYPVAKDHDVVLATLKEEPRLWLPIYDVGTYNLEKLEQSKDENGNQRFFIKNKKGGKQKMIDFILGRTDVEYLSTFAVADFDRKARFAFASVSSEIVLSPKIKKLVALNEFQELVKRHGFTGLMFSEPIAAIVAKKSKEKYLIYKHINKVASSSSFSPILAKLAQELKQLFLNNGIISHDLDERQFVLTDNGCVVLIDTEAYTEEKTPTTPEGSPREVGY